jgi:hypothetical protein
MVNLNNQQGIAEKRDEIKILKDLTVSYPFASLFFIR